VDVHDDGRRPVAPRQVEVQFQRPVAISHVSWVVPDVAAESARLARLGCRLINTARSGPISVAWHDGGALFPHPVEVHQHNEVIAGMHDRLLALRTSGERAPQVVR